MHGICANCQQIDQAAHSIKILHNHPSDLISIGLAGLPVDVPEDGKPPFNLAQRNLERGRHFCRGLASGQTLARHLDINDHNILTSLEVTTAIQKPGQPGLFTRKLDSVLTKVFGGDTPLVLHSQRGGTTGIEGRA